MLWVCRLVEERRSADLIALPEGADSSTARGLGEGRCCLVPGKCPCGQQMPRCAPSEGADQAAVAHNSDRGWASTCQTRSNHRDERAEALVCTATQCAGVWGRGQRPLPVCVYQARQRKTACQRLEGFCVKVRRL